VQFRLRISIDRLTVQDPVNIECQKDNKFTEYARQECSGPEHSCRLLRRSDLVRYLVLVTWAGLPPNIDLHDLIERDAVLAPIVELRGAGRGIRCIGRHPHRTPGVAQTRVCESQETVQSALMAPPLAGFSRAVLLPNLRNTWFSWRPRQDLNL
jgi:hypothetical protein